MAFLLTGVYCFAYLAAETLPPMFGPTLAYLIATTGEPRGGVTVFSVLLKASAPSRTPGNVEGD